MIIHFDPADVSCPHVRRFLYDYAERGLDSRLLMAMDNHVLACPECRDLVETYRLSIEAARRTLASSEAIPPKVRSELVRRLGQAQGR
jgi:hypothetical protein